MGLFVNKQKVKAAVFSMHQFCPVVRGVYRELPDDDVVEAATAFLYERLAREIFGKRFAEMVRHYLQYQYKFAPVADIEARRDRIERNVEIFRRQEEATAPAQSSQDEFTHRVRSVIRAFLAEAGMPYDDDELVCDAFPRFDETVRRVRAHLEGIRRQSRYVMK